MPLRRAWTLGHGLGIFLLGLTGNMLKDAYFRAVDVCELFPQFDFLTTLQEEVLLHHTRLPLVRLPVSTLLLIAATVVVVLTLYLRVIELVWLAMIELFSGRWLYNLLFVHIPNWLPFLASDPGVPELLSDGQDDDELDDDGMAGLVDATEINGVASATHASSSQRNTTAAMQRLVEVKLRQQNRTITRPDTWLVFDPQVGTLVTQKAYDARRRRQADLTAEATAAISGDDADDDCTPEMLSDEHEDEDKDTIPLPAPVPPSLRKR